MNALAAIARNLRRAAIVLVALVCLACVYPGLLQHTYSDQAVPAQRFDFQDGGHAIYFTLDKSLGWSQSDQAATMPTLTCLSLAALIASAPVQKVEPVTVY